MPRPKPLSRQAESSRRAEAMVGRPVNRAAIVDASIRKLAAQIEVDYYALCELVIEARDGQYYERLGFLDLEAYLMDRLGLSARSVLKRLAPAEALLTFPEPMRERVQKGLSEIGSSKAAVLAPALRRDPDGALDWLKHAAAETVEKLQERVSTALGLKPRGAAAAPGDRFLRMVINQVPTEARDEVAEVFALGLKIHGLEHAVGVFLAMVKEVRVEWDHRAANLPTTADQKDPA